MGAAYVSPNPDSLVTEEVRSRAAAALRNIDSPISRVVPATAGQLHGETGSDFNYKTLQYVDQ